ncbi:MAG: DUF2231 domain-containing protein [Campylobacterota bacterium]|nr:DUF2231 domain-containing protein [Campylobacterota bacterium]
MELPVITLPKVELPFDIPVLLHPVVDHFIIALPVVILLLELINLVLKKKAIGGISFFLIFLTIIAAVGAYLTGLVDGKEAYPALGEAAKTALAEHKNLGIYLLLGSGVLFFFKFLSSVTGNGILRFLYLIVLIVFVAGIFKQGQEGGELVYKYGMNVEQVQTLDDELFDVKEELEEVSSMLKKTNVTTPPAVIKVPEVKDAPKAIPAVEAPKLKSVPKEPVVIVIPEVKHIQESPAEVEVENTEKKREQVKVVPEVPVVEIPKIPAVPAVIPAKPAVPAAPAVKAEAAVKRVVETVRTDVKESVVPAIEQSVKTLEVEGMPEEMIQPEIETH